MMSIITKNQMFQVLNTKIMDRIINEKWNGVNCETRSLIEYSTGWQVTMVDRYDAYSGLDWLRKIFGYANDWKRGELSHIFKYFIWKKSMLLRANIEVVIIVIYSLIYLQLVVIFVKDLHKAESEAR